MTSINIPITLTKTNGNKKEFNSHTHQSLKTQIKAFFNYQTILSILLFLITGPCLIITNKIIISELNFHYPIFVTSLGITSSSIIIHIGHYFNFIQIRKEVKKLMTYDFIFRRIAIISLLQSLTMYFGNRAYIYLSVSFIQMLKAFTPVITLLMLYASKQTSMSSSLLSSIIILCVGTAVTTNGVSHTDYSPIGFLLAAGAQFSEALKLTLKQKLLHEGFIIKVKVLEEDSKSNTDYIPLMQHLRQNIGNSSAMKEIEVERSIKLSTFEGLYYYAPTTILCLILIAIPLEMSHFYSHFNDNMNIIGNYYYLFIIAGLLGFGVNVSAFMITKIISGLYLKALNTFRNVFVVILSVFIFGDVITVQQGVGYCITLIGFSYYNYVKVSMGMKKEFKMQNGNQ